MAGVRVIVFDSGGGLSLYVRLPGGKRLLAEAGVDASLEPPWPHAARAGRGGTALAR